MLLPMTNIKTLFAVVTVLFAVVTVLHGTNIHPHSLLFAEIAARKMAHFNGRQCLFSPYPSTLSYRFSGHDTTGHINAFEVCLTLTNPTYTSIFMHISDLTHDRFIQRMTIELFSNLSNGMEAELQQSKGHTIAAITNLVVNDRLQPAAKIDLSFLVRMWMEKLADRQSPPTSSQSAPTEDGLAWLGNKTMHEVNTAINKGMLGTTAKHCLRYIANQWMIKLNNNCEIDMGESLKLGENRINIMIIRNDGLWEYPFDSRDNSEKPFFSQSSSVKITMMRTRGIFPVYEKDGTEAIAIPYKGSQVYMLIIVPNEPVKEFAEDLTGEKLLQYFNDTLETRQDVLVEIPKFNLGFNWRTQYRNSNIFNSIHLQVHEYGTGNVTITGNSGARSGSCSGPSPAKRPCHLFFVRRPFLFAKIGVDRMVHLIGIFSGLPMQVARVNGSRLLLINEY